MLNTKIVLISNKNNYNLNNLIHSTAEKYYIQRKCEKIKATVTYMITVRKRTVMASKCIVTKNALEKHNTVLLSE